MKKILTIQDISCFGKCSLTVVLPILSSMQIETSVIPTALLSTHTGYSDFTFLDLTKEVDSISNHFMKLNLKFDGLYIGYLGSINLVKTIDKVISKLDFNQLIILDPVMGDNGQLYSNFNYDYVKALQELCKHSNIIIPNVTEAFLLLDRPYNNAYKITDIDELLFDLYQKYNTKIIITGIVFDKECVGCKAYDGKNFYVGKRNIEKGSYHGTGDIFSSIISGSIVKGFSIPEAMELGMDFVSETIKLTDSARDERLGVEFEKALYMLK